MIVCLITYLQNRVDRIDLSLISNISTSQYPGNRVYVTNIYRIIISFYYFRCLLINHYRPPSVVWSISLFYFIVSWYRKITLKKDVLLFQYVYNVYNSNAWDRTIYLLAPLLRETRVLNCILKFVALNLHAGLNSQEQSPACRVVEGLSWNITRDFSLAKLSDIGIYDGRRKKNKR